MKKDNPFTLTFGKQPKEYISRFENTEEIISNFTSNHPVSQTYLIEGVRGSGKTVMMTTITAELLKRENWLVVDVNAANDPVDDLAMRLSDTYRKLPNPMKQGFNISVLGIGVGIGGDKEEPNSITVIEDILKFCKKKGKRLLVTIDEVVPGQNMRKFATEYQLLIRKDYPIFLLMTGLYENIYAIQNDPMLTFLLRTPKVNLRPLSLYQIARQYELAFGISVDEAKQLASITKGYAFAFQALGVVFYENHDKLSLDEMLIKLDSMLDDFVYKKIWESLSDREREIVRAIEDTEIKVSEVCDRVHITSESFSRYRDKLIKRGIIESNRHGYVSLALPRFSFISKFY